jgi:hypothetical protein
MILKYIQYQLVSHHRRREITAEFANDLLTLSGRTAFPVADGRVPADTVNRMTTGSSLDPAHLA